MRRSWNKIGFTILEILVVISVIAILLGIAIPRFKGMQDDVKLIKAKREVAVITAALESFRRSDPSHAFPIEVTAITTLQANHLITANPRIISTVLYDPFATTPLTEYSYMTSADGKYYVIWSVGIAGQRTPTAISNTGVITY